jgi:hypothetical protein
MQTLASLIEFLDRLKENYIYYKLNKIRDSILVEVVVPGERWEVEFMEDGTIQIEKFASNGEIYGEEQIEVLFDKFGEDNSDDVED